MLRLLSIIFYVLAAASVFLAMTGFNTEGSLPVAPLAATLSCAFFGAMCWAADEALTLLRKLAGVEDTTAEPTGEIY
jgi:hypothetical protein